MHIEPGERSDQHTLPGNAETLTDKSAMHGKKEELITYPLIKRGIPFGERYELPGKCIEETEKV